MAGRPDTAIRLRRACFAVRVHPRLQPRGNRRRNRRRNSCPTHRSYSRARHLDADGDRHAVPH